MFRTLNADHAPDLYVCNGFQSPDRIGVNDGQGRFQATAREAILPTSLFPKGIGCLVRKRSSANDGTDTATGHSRMQESETHRAKCVSLLDTEPIGDTLFHEGGV